MSQKFPGGFVTKSPVAPTTTAASGIWTLDQQEQYQKAGTWPSPPMFIEDLFSTYLYAGTGSSLSINNGIDLAGKGGLTWIKSRTSTVFHNLVDTARGNTSYIYSNVTDPADVLSTRVTSFNSNGFTLGPTVGTNPLNNSGVNYTSWTFRKQPNFFDVVTYTGTGSSQYINHSLGSVPGCIILKSTTNTDYWIVYHQSIGNTGALFLQDISAVDTGTGYWQNTSPTSTQFRVGASCSQSGQSYVAYIFAHDAGGFPASGGGSTNGISCGSFTANASGIASINLGYEPQWLLVKCSSTTDDWLVVDNPRGFFAPSTAANVLRPNLSNAENTGYASWYTNSTGFSDNSAGGFIANATYVYIAIRRGPMKTPTTGTEVYGTTTWVGSSGTKTTSAPSTNFATGFSAFVKARNYPQDWGVFDQLRGTRPFLLTNTTSTQINDGVSAGGLTIWPNTIYLNGGSYFGGGGDGTGYNYTTYLFKRAPSFFDQLCYSGTGVDRNITHNLGVAPELIFVKARTGGINQNWNVCFANTGTNNLVLNDNRVAFVDSTRYPTSGGVFFPTYFKVGTANGTNASGYTYSAYIFASCPGVSKVGSYTGTGALQTINCGFASGARFVLIKRTDDVGDWFVYDSTSGISSGNDPYVLMDLLDVEVTGTNYVDTDTTGFKVTAAAPAGLNASGGSYIFLAIA